MNRSIYEIEKFLYSSTQSIEAKNGTLDKFKDLIKKIKLNLNNFSILHIDSIKNLHLDIKDVLTHDELVIYEKYKLAKGKNEFFIGRLLMKLCLIKEIDQKKNRNKLQFHDFNITRNEYGKPLPHFINKILKDIDLAVSHKNNYVFCGVISQKSIGVDVEEITERLSNVRKFFINNDEEQIINDAINYNSEKLDYFAMLWASKEAIVKYASSDFMKIAIDAQLKNIQNYQFEIEYTNDESSRKLITYNYLYNNYAFSFIVG